MRKPQCEGAQRNAAVPSARQDCSVSELLSKGSDSRALGTAASLSFPALRLLNYTITAFWQLQKTKTADRFKQSAVWFSPAYITSVFFPQGL